MSQQDKNNNNQELIILLEGMNNQLKVLTTLLVMVCKTNQALTPNSTNEVLKTVENDTFTNF